VLVRDVLDADITSPADRATLEQLGEILRSARRSRRVQLSQRSIIVLETTAGTPTAGQRDGHRQQQGRGRHVK
jgi:hypothetical protein